MQPAGSVSRNPRYNILFEPVQIGPVVAPNRFYQVPHCTGMGHRYAEEWLAMRAEKAEGGWGVVCTEECEIHPSSEFAPYNEARLWDSTDTKLLARMADAVHAHGALAGIELAYNGPAAPNRLSRLVAMAPAHRPVDGYDPVQARAMTRADIARLRQWHRNAALRAVDAGFDIIYVYAGHALALPMHFLSRRYNDRTDEYGGCLRNRVRLLQELITDTRDAVGHRAGVAVRLAVDELLGEQGIEASAEGYDVVAMLAELPDLWDVNLSDWSNDSQTARFAAEGFQTDYVSFVKTLTTKPVVGVGRFTSPDVMVEQIRSGALDLIGAARASIADPFLPRKVDQGLEDSIRECIGCNVCVSGDFTMTPMRCTQNPTMGEQWRRGWHAERVNATPEPQRVLVVGAGPAGLECTVTLAKAGHHVLLAEATRDLGGRVTREATLPGLHAWRRVVDYRRHIIDSSSNVEVYLDSRMAPEHFADMGVDRVVLATGCRWRRDGVGRALRRALPNDGSVHVMTPDDVLDGVRPMAGPVVVYDDDHYYMGGVLAEWLRAAGFAVTLLTPAPDVSHWTHYTLEQSRIARRLSELKVRVKTQSVPTAIIDARVRIRSLVSEREIGLRCGTLVLVTARMPDESLHDDVVRHNAHAGGVNAVHRIGDCVAPGTIAAAVYSGHALARHFEQALQYDEYTLMAQFARHGAPRGEA